MKSGVMGMKLNNFFLFLMVISALFLVSWEDHPDRDDHRDTDRNFRDAQEQTNCQDSGDGSSRSSESDYNTSNDSCCSEERGASARDRD